MRASAAGSSGSAARSSARSSFVRLRLVVVTIAGLGSSLAGVGSSTRSGGTTAAGLPRFRTTAGTAIATAFRFFGGRLGRGDDARHRWGRGVVRRSGRGVAMVWELSSRILALICSNNLDGRRP